MKPLLYLVCLAYAFQAVSYGKPQSPIGDQVPRPVLASARAVGAAYAIPPSLLLALADQESGFNRTAVSSKNCRGLLQINPNIWMASLREARIARTADDLFEIETNFLAGAHVLHRLARRSRDREQLLWNYLGAVNRTYSSSVLRKWHHYQQLTYRERSCTIASKVYSLPQSGSREVQLCLRFQAIPKFMLWVIGRLTLS